MEERVELKRHLKILSKQYTNIEQVAEEIINLQAILNLPKGTELFLSDIHGEYGSFSHILNNGSGIIRNKIEDIFNNQITERDRRQLATLIYYPEEKLALIKKEVEDIKEWYSINLYRLIEVAREVSSKYTRSKVRKAMPKGFDYIIDELLHLQGCGPDKETYYKQIISSIIELDRADEFIVAISNLIKRMAIDHLHVIGDIFDRGPNAKLVMDTLMNFHSLDIELGNHDILWMGAACGNKACIANVIRICSRYDNIDTLEDGYGINIRPLATFALETYKDDNCEKFVPKVFDYNKYIRSDEISIAKIHKAISIIQFKLEGQIIKEHPEYKMDGRLLLDKIDYEKGTIQIDNKIYNLNDTNFPTVDYKNPYKLTKEEEEIINRLQESFKNSETLNKHISFLYSKASMYKFFNSNLLFHGCVPMEEDGEFDVLPKKEVALLRKEKEKLTRNLEGIKEMRKIPNAIFVIDPRIEHNAVAEAHKLGIPVFGIVDTNCDPDEVDYAIPANDDAIRSVRLILAVMADAVVESKGGQTLVAYTKDEGDGDVTMTDAIQAVDKADAEKRAAAQKAREEKEANGGERRQGKRTGRKPAPKAEDKSAETTATVEEKKE